MSEDVFDITGFLEIVKRQKELRDESPKISKAEIWMALAADFNRKISLEDVDEADEYLITHELMGTLSPLHTEDAPKTETAQSAPPAPQSTRTKENPYSSGDSSGKATEEPRKQPEAPPLQSETQPSNLTIPKGVEPIPVKEIDDLIEQHYTREGIAKTMQARHHKSFYSTINQRMKLYNQRVYGAPLPTTVRLPTEKTGKSDCSRRAPRLLPGYIFK
jgi:hypothetical protein